MLVFLRIKHFKLAINEVICYQAILVRLYSIHIRNIYSLNVYGRKYLKFRKTIVIPKKDALEDLKV